MECRGQALAMVVPSPAAPMPPHIYLGAQTHRARKRRGLLLHRLDGELRPQHPYHPSRLDVLKLGKSEKIGLHFDARERLNLGQSDYSSSVANERVDIMNVDYTSETLYLAVGRLWPKELPIERIDGINVMVKKGHHGFGFFGGYNPNPYTEAFTTEYTAVGAYYFYQKEELGARVGFANKGFKGRTDRQYIYGEATYFPAEGFSLYSSATIDIPQDIGGIKITNGMVELTYRPDHTKSVTFGYNQFRSFKLYESMDYAVDDSRQDAYYVSGQLPPLR